METYDFCSDVHRWSTTDLENILTWMEFHAPATPSRYVDQIEAVSGELGQRQRDEQEAAYQSGLRG